MKSNIENDNKFKIRILFFLILLLFLLVLVQPFIIIYLLQHSNIRMASPVTEVDNMNTGKNNDENAIINENTIGHQAKKREISSDTEKDCQGDCSLTPNPSEINEDTIMIKENWSVKKADLLEYCFTAVDFCQKNKNKSKDKQKDNFGNEKQQENKNCILQKITDEEALQYHQLNARGGLRYELTFIDIEEGPKDNYKIIARNWDGNEMTEFRLNEKQEVKILKKYELPEQMSYWGSIEYNGNIYSPHKSTSELRIVKYNIETGKLTFGDIDDIVQYKFGMNLFPGDNFFWAIVVSNYSYGMSSDKISVGYKMDFDNLKVLSKRNFRFNLCFINMFVAYDKVYWVHYRRRRFYIRSASNDEEFLYIDLQKHPDPYRFERVFYNVSEQNLYIQFSSFAEGYIIIVKKLHFNCSNEV